ncbi:hypothetical protein [Streptomyces sp. NPDC041003]|uniref:hypothetical protein n=1 Tax=Streptomyces sp. NPDC041003 TaxID=3155730 RepID=UPI0033F4AB59
MPATVHHEPLRVECVFPDGTRWTARLDDTRNPALAADLALGLTSCIHPHGRITKLSTVRGHVATLKTMVNHLAKEGFVGGAANLSRSNMVNHWLAFDYYHGAKTRALLSGYDRETGALRQEVRVHLEGRALKSRPASEPHKPYTDGEWQRLQDIMRRLANESWQGHKSALALAAAGGDPREYGMSRENVAWLLLNHGPMSSRELIAATGCAQKSQWVKADLPKLRSALYPSAYVMHAHRLLLGMYTGVVPDGIADLGLDGITWAGNSTVLMDYVKGRSGPESVTITKRAVALLERWLALSTPLRNLAAPELREDLWLLARRRTALTESPSPYVVVNIDKGGDRAKQQRELISLHGVLDDSGQALQIHASRIRETHINIGARRSWTGRTTIDPNHTPGVEGDHYASAQTSAQKDAIGTIVEEAQADVLRKALPPNVLTEDELASVAVGLPDAAARLGLNGDELAELLGGERDVFTASCKNQLAGIHGPKGKPCPARPWICLLCPLSVFMPRHAPNLLRLKAYFSRQFRQMTNAQFIAIFGPYADRLERDILARFPTAVLERAAMTVINRDAEIPLRPEELTP